MSMLFATPMYGGHCTEPFFHSVMRTIEELTKSGIEYDWLTERNESLVHRARMEMAAAFLKTKHTHLFWIDADIEFEPEHVAALWNLDVDIATGVYRMKKQNSEFAAWKDGKLLTDLSGFSGPTEIDLAGGGFVLVKRRVIERLAEKQGTFHGPNGRTPAIYMTPIMDDALIPEDYFFSRIARESGFKIVMDPSVKLKHWGMAAYG